MRHKTSIAIFLALLIAVLLWQAPASWLAHTLNKKFTSIEIIDSQGLWYRGQGRLVLKRKSGGHELANIQWNLGLNGHTFFANGTQIDVQGLNPRTLSWSTPIVLNPVAIGSKIQFASTVSINPGSWTIEEPVKLTGAMLAPHVTVMNMRRTLSPISWKYENNAFALEGASLQGTITPNPWTVHLQTPFRQGDAIYEALSVLTGRPASTIDIIL